MQRVVQLRPGRPYLVKLISRLRSLIMVTPGISSRIPSARRLPVKPRASSTMLLAGWLVAIGLMVAVATVVLIVKLREHALAEAEHEQRSLALILADQAERAFEAVELVQTALQERLRADSIRTPEAFRQAMTRVAVHNELHNMGRTLPQLEAIVVVDANGMVINHTRPEPVPNISVADRTYFISLKSDPDRTTFISEPLRNRTNGNWNVDIVRKVTGPGGEFLGLIIGAMNLQYFEQLYQAVALGRYSTISLHCQDGTLLVRYPHVDPPIGRSLGKSGAFRIVGTVGPDGIVFRLVSPIDGTDRLIAARSLVHYRMVVTVANRLSAILEKWHRQSIYLTVSACILELGIGAVGSLVLRQLHGQRMLTEARAELTVAHERERAGQALRMQNVRFGAALSNMSQALCMFDAADTLIVANARLAEMFGMDAASIGPGVTLELVVSRALDASNLQRSDIGSMFASIQRLKIAGVPATHMRDLADGRTLAVNFVPIEDDGWLVTLEDVTQRRLVESKITHMAHHDALTDLPNRVLFHERLSEAVARSRRGEEFALLYLDLDHFKEVNDSLGHPVGDALLREVSMRLRQQVRETDTVARLGGDEFAIIQSSVDLPQDATALSERLIGALSLAYELDGQHVMIGTSIGIVVVPGDGDDPDQLLKRADIALYSAKADGRGRFRFFEAQMDSLMQTRRMLEIDLRKALIAGEFELYYQPITNIKNGMVTGFEALLRWHHPERGMVPPSEFVPLAEEIGLIIPLGKWVLQQACSDAATWPGPLKVAVNVSVVQFGSPTLVEDVVIALETSGLDPSRLEVEITETVMLDDTDCILVLLHRLRDLGVGISMDDFGTGYSSLSYLRRFPFSKVKIERSFTEGLGRGRDNDAIVAAVTELCKTLGMTTLAEGVETEAQLQMLRGTSCGEAQGYLFSPPRPAREVAAICRKLNPPEWVGEMV